MCNRCALLSVSGTTSAGGPGGSPALGNGGALSPGDDEHAAEREQGHAIICYRVGLS